MHTVSSLHSRLSRPQQADKSSSYLRQYQSWSDKKIQIKLVPLHKKFSQQNLCSPYLKSRTLVSSTAESEEGVHDKFKPASERRVVLSSRRGRKSLRLTKGKNTTESEKESDFRWGASARRGAVDRRKFKKPKKVKADEPNEAEISLAKIISEPEKDTVVQTVDQVVDTESDILVEAHTESDLEQDATEEEGEEEEEEEEEEKPCGSDHIDFGLRERIQATEANWYLVQVQPNRERSAAKNIEEINKRDGDFARVETLVPTVMEVGRNPRTGRPIPVKKLIMPGYVMVRTRMDNRMHDELRHTWHVKGFMGYNHVYGPRSDQLIPLPLPMKKTQLDAIQAEMTKEQEIEDERAVEEYAPAGFPFEIADVVTVISGPYKGFSGQVMAYDAAEMTIDCLLVIFGKNTEVTLPTDDVEKSKAQKVEV